MNARAVILGSLALAAIIAAACGGSSGGAFPGPDGGGSSSGGGSGGSSSGTNGGQDCTGTAPQIECTVCGTTSLATAQCINGAWGCPELPVHCAPDDAGIASGNDGAAGDSGSQADASFPCTSCDPHTNFCEISYGPPPNDGGSGVPTDYCAPFDCDSGAPSCACATIGPFCSCADDSGAVTVTCPFHP